MVMVEWAKLRRVASLQDLLFRTIVGRKCDSGFTG